jgi:hypothetical protein
MHQVSSDEYRRRLANFKARKHKIEEALFITDVPG